MMQGMLPYHGICFLIRHHADDAVFGEFLLTREGELHHGMVYRCNALPITVINLIKLHRHRKLIRGEDLHCIPGKKAVSLGCIHSAVFAAFDDPHHITGADVAARLVVLAGIGMPEEKSCTVLAVADLDSSPFTPFSRPADSFLRKAASPSGVKLTISEPQREKGT